MKQVFLDTLSLEDARRLLFSRLNSIDLSLPSEKVDVRNSAGRITAEAVFARYSSPFYHSAAMDGYAVRFSDTFTASETSPSLLRIGYDAVYVDTGDPMPEGFNAVVMVEDINIIRREGMGDGQEDECIEIYEPVTPYQHVRTIGEDIVATELIIPENHEIRAIDAGAMLASGHTEISVRKMPKIAIIPTGTEIVEPDVVKNRPPAPPEIIEYNSSVLSGLAHESGAETVRFNIVRDDMEDIKKAIDEASKTCDIVLVNAGSGRGSEDYTLAAVKELGEVIINGVSIKPGKPFIAGFVNNRPVFGIPGYPVSAYLTFQLFVKPVISRILGVALKEKEKIKAVISRQIASPMGVDEFIRVKVGVVNDKYIATPAGRGAGLLMSLVRADGIIRIPADTEALSAGTEVEVELIRDKNEIKNTIVCIGSHDNTMDILANAVKRNTLNSLCRRRMWDRWAV